MEGFTYRTAGESHGPGLTVLLEGLPAGLELDPVRINADLARRQSGYGRGGRMKIETDQVEILAGVRWGKTTGAPVVLSIRNRDWANWQEAMSSDSRHAGSAEPLTNVRPGHADLSGMLKYNLTDARNVLERSSARETAARVAAGGVAKAVLAAFDVSVGSYVQSVGEVGCSPTGEMARLHELAEKGELRIPDPEVDEKACGRVDEARKEGDTLGGVFVCFATGVVVGLGSHVSHSTRLEGKIGRAFLSIPAIKAVEIGDGFEAARNPGSKVHDEIFKGSAGDLRRGGYRRETNNAGGIEGGMTNGETVWVRAAMKPIPTLMKPLRTVDVATGEPADASKERSDVCAVPAASIVGEAALAIELAGALLEKFGGDSIEEAKRNFNSYLRLLEERWKS